ncbi:hypothetical protein [Paenibacillus methanolicus]|uniref:Uncharacterized protein n=1 Tax=Paenibacillus methanolicus TaxID=582686 RepID=A0A5S5BW27_9BACL|nr:hypothetical protein [Paenibacillus methanolicus]TYP71385.1 hypothetical protein BCM02_110341 [Paenibacillus methanolicus]
MMTFESEYRRQAIRTLREGREEAKSEIAMEASRYRRTFANWFSRMHAVTAPFLGPSNRPMR